jgi:hypothetical protein
MNQIKDPETPDEWRRATICAISMLALAESRKEGHMRFGPGVDAERCRSIAEAGIARGIDLAEIMPEVEQFSRQYAAYLVNLRSGEVN